jgi:NYN domain
MADFSEYPHMIFVDGENLTIRGQEFAKNIGLDLVRGPYWEPDTFLWIPDVEGEYPMFSEEAWMARHHHKAETRARRAYYYTAVVGDDTDLRRTRLAIRELGFEPNVFKKLKGTRSKGVDVSLTATLVSHAYRESYYVAYLIAGDGDYVPMVEEAKRLGAGLWSRSSRKTDLATTCGSPQTTS